MTKHKLLSVFDSVAHEFAESTPMDFLLISAIAGWDAALGAGSFQEIVSGMAAGAAAYRVIEGIYKGLKR